MNHDTKVLTVPCDIERTLSAELSRLHVRALAGRLRTALQPSNVLEGIFSQATSVAVGLEQLSSALESLELLRQLKENPPFDRDRACSLPVVLARAVARAQRIDPKSAHQAYIDPSRPVPELFECNDELLEVLLSRMIQLAGTTVSSVPRSPICLIADSLELPDSGHVFWLEVRISVEAGFRHKQDPLLLSLGSPWLGLQELQLQLALHVLRSIARVMGGGLCVQADGEGACGVIVTFPIKIRAGGRLLGLEQLCRFDGYAGQRAGPRARSARILFVSDLPQQSHGLILPLKRAGLHIESVTSSALDVPHGESSSSAALILFTAFGGRADPYRQIRRLRASGQMCPCLLLEPKRWQFLDLDPGQGEELHLDGVEIAWVPISFTELVQKIEDQLHGRLNIDDGPAEDALRSDLEADPDMTSIIQDFISWLPDRLKALEDCWSQGDHIGSRQLAHELKGTSGMCGFGSIAQAAARLEDPLRAGQTIDSLTAELKHLLKLCERALGSYDRDTSTESTAADHHESVEVAFTTSSMVVNP